MSNKATRISADDLSTFAAQGIDRALEARQAAGIELSAEELAQVSGGAILTLGGGIINGRLLNQFQSIVSKPTLGAVTLGATQLG